MAMETKRRDGRASDGRMSHVRMPVNALDAAKRAAHARPVERERLRAAAAGTRRAISNGAVERSSRAVSFAAALVGIGLALVVVYLIGGALTGVAHHRDGAAAGEAEVAVVRSSEGTAKKEHRVRWICLPFICNRRWMRPSATRPGLRRRVERPLRDGRFPGRRH